MTVNEKSVYLIDGGDYSIYCLGYTQARTVTNEILKRDPWGGIPFVYQQEGLELSYDDRGNAVMTKDTLERLLFIASDPIPEGEQ